MKRAPPVRWILLAIAAGLFALAAFSFVFPNWMRGPIESAVHKKTGRAFVIGGDLDIGFWSMRAPFLRMHDVRFDNPAWAESPHLVTASEAEFSIDIPALLAGRLVLPYVRLSRPEISMERDAGGQRSWVLKKEDDGGEPPQVRALSVDEGVIRFRDAVAVIDVTARVSTRGGSAEKPTTISFSGTYRKAPLKGEAQAGPVLNLQSTDEPFPMSIKLRKGETLIEADGTFTDIVHFGAIDTWLKVQGPDWSELDPLIPLPLPKSPPYSIEGRLKRSGTHTLYENFKGRVGSSDLSGTLSYDQSRDRPLLKAKLESRVLDLKDLGPVIGKPKATAAKPPAKGDKPQAKAPKGDRKLPTEPLNVERMNRIDADVVLNAKQLRRPDALPLDNFSTHLKLANGVLALEPLRFSMAGGAIDSTLKLDARRKPILANATVRLKNARLSRLFPKIEQMKDSTGVVGASLELSGKGESVAEMLGSSSGQMGVAMTGGTMSNLLVELLGLDGGEALKFLAGGDRKTDVRCAAASFVVKDGVATSQTMVFDTDDTNISGAGVVNLRDETLDVQLNPEPKDKSILVVRAPVRLHGPFADIDVSVDKKKIAARIGAAAVLGVINPLAALVPLIETGPGKDADCAKLLSSVDSVDKAKRAAHQPPPPTRLPPSTAEPRK